jgi:superfamily II DNA helicase RecQ
MSSCPNYVTTCIDEAVRWLDPALTLKPFQRESLESVVKNAITVVCALTGSGKSIIFSVLPYLFESLFREGRKMSMGPDIKDSETIGKKGILLVLPYLALTYDVLSSMRAKYPGLKFEHVDTEESAAAVYQNVVDGKTDIVVITPEMYCKKKCWELFNADGTKVKSAASILLHASILPAIPSCQLANGRPNQLTLIRICYSV